MGKLSGAKTQIVAFPGGLDVSREHKLSERMHHCLPKVWCQNLGSDCIRDSTNTSTFAFLIKPLKDVISTLSFFLSFQCLGSLG